MVYVSTGYRTLGPTQGELSQENDGRFNFLTLRHRNSHDLILRDDEKGFWTIRTPTVDNKAAQNQDATITLIFCRSASNALADDDASDKSGQQQH